ncbi:MAG: 30S ribosomal protein S7 [Patescibacteria group bacterium]
MPRRSIKNKRVVGADPVFDSVLVNKLVNRVMKDGKKTVARKHVYTALELIAKEKKMDALLLLEKAIENIKPKMEVRSRRVGGAAYQVPRSVDEKRQLSLAIRWLVFQSRLRPNKEYHTFAEKLAAELLSALKGEGGAITKREEAEKLAAANKAFAHLRW